MAEDVVIRAEGLGKKFVIGHQQSERYTALRDVIARGARNFVRSGRDLVLGRQIIAGDELEEFWALRDVDFEVRRGEVLGVIGRNGAGKSTLLKVLSRITEPSAGRVTLHGRVASLLEVGTGFHPELSGRENVFLNGAILGMSRAEIRRKFDEIVAFAGVERFLDTPVKRYSSGMYVRLAFAVAAHLESEIMVVDEVLAVGDAEFQAKCLGKMHDVAGQGRTVLFVSHNMAAVRRLCTSGILIRSGAVAERGDVKDVVAAYFASAEISQDQVVDLTTAKRRGDGRARISRIEFPDFSGAHSYRIFDKLRLRFSLNAAAESDMAHASVWFLFRNSGGDDVLMLMQKDSGQGFAQSKTAAVELEAELALAPGRYSVACGTLSHGLDVSDWVDEAFSLDVEPMFANGDPFDSRFGLTTMRAQWRAL
ncbi:MAG TPA: ABC transporter ATP-binding protein [Caulobacteraceae bacterium]|nr:ABC transporter ATP-binding protein [Caulobacteraceae bacterium]